jgi:ribosomal-protein-alanine N-acetyltransferase
MPPEARSIETKRLRLEPHEVPHLLALIESESAYEQASGRRIAPGLRGFFVSASVSPEWLAKLKDSKLMDLWVHGFAVLHKSENLLIGAAGFKGPADANGVVEIGYGIVPSFQNKGFATEAAQGLVEFAANSGKVRLVRAHTLPESNASSRVLLKCGFTKTGEVQDPEDGLVWRWERSVVAEPAGIERS